MGNWGFEPTEFGHLRAFPAATIVLPSNKHWDVNHRKWLSQPAALVSEENRWRLTMRCSAKKCVVSKLATPTSHS
jgi:hypothetical protein